MGATPKNKGNGTSLFKGVLIMVIVGAMIIVLSCQLVLFHTFTSTVEQPTKPHHFEDSHVHHGPEREHVKISGDNIDFCKQAGRELVTRAADGYALADPTVRTDVDNTAGQKMNLLVVHRAFDDVAWAHRFRDIADMEVRMLTNWEDELQEFVQYIVDNYDDLNPLVGFLHGPLDDWHWLPGGSLARWSSDLVPEGQEHPKRTRLTVDELVQAFKYLNSDYDRFKALYAKGFLGLHDISQQRCTEEEVHLLRVYMRCTWRSEPWLYRLREKFGWNDDALAKAPTSCRKMGNSVIHRDLIWMHSKRYWQSMLHTAQVLSQEVQWSWKRHVETHSILTGLSLWSILITTSFEPDFGWYRNHSFRPPGGFTAGNKSNVDDHNRDTHLSPLPRAANPPFGEIKLVHQLRTGGTWAKEVIHLAGYSCNGPSFQFWRHCKHNVQKNHSDNYCACIQHSEEAELNKWHFGIHQYTDLSKPLVGYRIHILREPCAYYVGVWRFQAQYARLRHPHIAQWNCLYGDEPDTTFFPRSMRGDKAIPKFPQHAIAFRKWMKSIHHGNTLGMYSWRLWTTQAHKDWVWKTKEMHLKQEADDGQRLQCARDVTKKRTRTIKDEFHDLDKAFGMTHCWVAFSNMPQDLAFCLRQFNEIHPGHFNEEYLQQLESQPRYQPTWPCAEMYDDETRKMVERMDGVVMKRFDLQC